MAFVCVFAHEGGPACGAAVWFSCKRSKVVFAWKPVCVALCSICHPTFSGHLDVVFLTSLPCFVPHSSTPRAGVKGNSGLQSLMSSVTWMSGMETATLETTALPSPRLSPLLSVSGFRPVSWEWIEKRQTKSEKREAT